MELQTVTPSRIQHSPTKIISRKSKLPTSPQPQDSNEPTHRKPPETPNKEPAPDSSKLFKIVISSTSTKNPPTRETKSESSHFLTSIDKLSDDAEAMDVDYDDKVMLDEEDQQHVQDIKEALNIKGDEAGEKRKQGASSRLPRELRGLMGEANLCYARGDHDD
uniref:Uncharacterized protein n=1 Tax=Ciona savignyi TaxID=51511 RepID=H2ZEF9_CIOSA